MGVANAARPVIEARQRLFFAVRLEGAAASRAFALAAQLRLRHGLKGRAIPMDRLHVTLHWLQDHAILPGALVADAIKAGNGVDTESFEAVFDRAGSLGDENHRGPLVL